MHRRLILLKYAALALLLVALPARTSRAQSYEDILAQYPDAQEMTTRHDGVQILVRPNSGARSGMALQRGEVVLAFDRLGPYTKIATLEEGYAGYVQTSYLEPYEEGAVVEAGPRQEIGIKSQRSAADAQRSVRAVSIGAGFGRGEFANPESGFASLVLGGVLGASSLFVTGDLHADLVMTGEDDSGYYWDQGVDRCRESHSGRFAESASCGAGEFFFAATVDANYMITASGVYLGAGYRAGTFATPYLSGGWILSPLQNFSMGFRGKLWADFADFSFLFTIPF